MNSCSLLTLELYNYTAYKRPVSRGISGGLLHYGLGSHRATGLTARPVAGTKERDTTENTEFMARPLAATNYILNYETREITRKRKAEAELFPGFFLCCFRSYNLTRKTAVFATFRVFRSFSKNVAVRKMSLAKADSWLLEIRSYQCYNHFTVNRRNLGVINWSQL